MIDTLVPLLRGIGDMLLGSIPTLIGLAATFTAISAFFTPCNPGTPWWRKPDLLVDIGYFFLFPFVARLATLVFLSVGIAMALALSSRSQAGELPLFEHGPLRALSFWTQLAVYLLLADLMLYWSHRAFHTASLWRYHAVHHSPEHLDWTSARRFHPVDAALHCILPDFVLLMLGISPDVIVFLAPFNTWYSALVHANLNWSFGPFKYVLVGPVFHRWHHTDAHRGGSKNFSATFPVFDLLFGTFYMPHGALPDRYGVDDSGFPKGLGRQILYPFRTGDQAMADGAFAIRDRMDAGPRG